MILFAESRLARVEMQQVFAADPNIYTYLYIADSALIHPHLLTLMSWH